MMHLFDIKLENFAANVCKKIDLLLIYGGNSNLENQRRLHANDTIFQNWLDNCSHLSAEKWTQDQEPVGNL